MNVLSVRIACSYILSILFFNLNNRNKLTDVIILALNKALLKVFSDNLHTLLYGNNMKPSNG